MKYKLLYKNFFLILGMDILFLSGSLYVSHLVRFDFKIEYIGLRPGEKLYKELITEGEVLYEKDI